MIILEDYGVIISNAFDKGSIRDAALLFDACIHNAFPTFNFRGLELIRFLKDGQYMEGKSWNHVFEIRTVSIENNPVWEVICRRVTMGKTPDKQVYLEYKSLGFVQYKEV